MTNNVNKVGVSTTTKESFIKSFDYSVATTMPLDILETDWLQSRLSDVAKNLFYKKNYLLPIITEGGRLLIKDLYTEKNLNDYTDGLGYTNDKSLNKLRPKAIYYLKYLPSKYWPATPEDYIEKRYDQIMRQKREKELDKLAKEWQADLELLTFITK